MEKRGRNACWKCKERRVRCGLERPTCRNCARSGHQCQYGLKLLWREEALARGICFGRQGVYGRATPKTPLSNGSLGLEIFKGEFHFFNASNADFESSGSIGTQDCGVAHAGNLPPNITTAGSALDEDDNDSAHGQFAEDPATIPCGVCTGLPPIPDGDVFELHLFDFYIHGLCPNLSNSPHDNPYLEFIAPLVFASPPLYHSVLSWSAHELAFRNPSDDRCGQVSVKHKVKALRGLREEVERSQRDHGPPPSTLISVLATMIILSCQEIVETCSSAWIEHLKAARMLCSILWPAGHETPDNFRKFCVMWFVSHEIMSRTAWIQETLFEPSEWFAGDDETEIDPMIGCSRGLIHEVSRIGTLIMEKRKGLFDGNNDGGLVMRRNRIEDSLQKLGQSISTNRGSAPAELLEVAESKRLCALIYLYTCIDDARPSTPAVQSMTTRVIELLTKLPPKPSLTFPLFVVGTLGVWNESDRRLVLDKFTHMIRARPLASIVKASDIVRAVWLDRDLGKCGRWEDLVETRGKLLSLA